MQKEVQVFPRGVLFQSDVGGGLATVERAGRGIRAEGEERADHLLTRPMPCGLVQRGIAFTARRVDQVGLVL